MPPWSYRCRRRLNSRAESSCSVSFDAAHERSEKLAPGDGEDGSKKKGSFEERIKEAFEEQSIEVKLLR